MAYKIASLMGIVALATICSGNSHVTTLSSASANEFIDRLMYNFRPEAVNLNIDPWHVPPIDLPFNFTFLFADHQGELNVTDAYLIGLSMLERSGDCVLTYDFKMMQITVNFVIKELLMDGSYSLHALGMNPAGNIFCHLEEQTVSVSVLIDIKDSNVDLQHFETTNDKDLQIKIDGLGILGDALANVVIGAVKIVMKAKIISLISNNIGTVLADFVSKIHFLPPIPDQSTVAPLFV